MFGYVTINKPELKIREFERYRGFYCGLCRCLRERHGVVGQMTLTYDMTFLILLLTSVYEPMTRETEHRCLVHPAKRQLMIANAITEYAADMNILLSHAHLEDDWKDERRLRGLMGMKIFGGKRERIAQNYPRQSSVMTAALAELSERERENCTEPDLVAEPFAKLLGELFVWRDDGLADLLRGFGFYLGKYIYFLDAYMDVEQDVKKNCYNPFSHLYQKDFFEDRVKEILEGTLRMTIVEFEKLPCEQDLEILRNILYEGIRIQANRGNRRGFLMSEEEDVLNE